MSYDTDREFEQGVIHDREITAFIARHALNPHPGPRRTLILFPGGMGSQLGRASTPANAGPPFNYNTAWLDCAILFGSALQLQMAGDEDLNRQYVIANGCVEFGLLDLRPYAPFFQWCSLQGIDWLPFAWDWRQSPERAAKHFLTEFLPKFRSRVQSAAGIDPTADLTLVGHSFGGHVAKLILQSNHPSANRVARAITVGTPFYGHAAHLHRYFAGDVSLNPLPGYGARNVTRTLSSFRGCYLLMPLPGALFARDQVALAADPICKLQDYPCVDATTQAATDPYRPGTSGTRVRYPANFGFQPAQLEPAEQIVMSIAEPLAAPKSQKLYHLRGIQMRDGGTAYETIHGQSWDWIRANFDPGVDPSPITDTSVCPGDGVIPAWSARLVSTPAANIRTLRGDINQDGFEHMDLLSVPSIQAEIGNIMGLPMVLAMMIKPEDDQASATREEVAAFLEEMGRTRSLSSALAIIGRLGLQRLRAFVRKLYIDAPKSPSQKRGTMPAARGAVDEQDPKPSDGRKGSDDRKP
jgi:pimeloyl-ACP methyl ester carboxylesterase